LPALSERTRNYRVVVGSKYAVEADQLAALERARDLKAL
jgi:hypothetical protein